jgi:hypothetical protein
MAVEHLFALEGLGDFHAGSVLLALARYVTNTHFNDHLTAHLTVLKEVHDWLGALSENHGV